MKNNVAMREPDVPSTRVVEVGGVKMEVDMRVARKVEYYKVGTNVRILKKGYSDNEYTTYNGVIVGFDQFKAKPSILIAYLKKSYGDVEIEFLTFNDSTKDVEICTADISFIPFEKSTVIEILNNKITEAEQSLLEARAKKEYFEKHFDEYFKDVK